MRTFILLFQCRDQRGIVARISKLIFECGGNIITADQYSTDPEGGYFFMRVEFVIEAGSQDKASLEEALKKASKEFSAQYSLYDKRDVLRMGIFVSRPDHCLVDLLYLWRTGELRVSISFVASNFEGHKAIVEQLKIPFYYVKAGEEERLLDIAQCSDFLALARYMRVLSPQFLKKYGKDIINIHHGLLPSFKGSHPYRQALDSGVKVIGATCHFVTEKLDDGPIIAQATEEVTHRDGLAQLERKGRNLEKRALSEALHRYIDYRVIRFNNKTIVF